MHRGYAKLWRKSLDSAVWKNPNLWRFWTWCLMKATHKEITEMVGYQEVHLLPGQFVFGRKQAAKETGLSEQTIRTCLVSFQQMENLTIKATNKFSILTIVKWEDYQQEFVQTTSKSTISQPASNQLVTTNKHISTEEVREEVTSNEVTRPQAEPDGQSPLPINIPQKPDNCPHREIIALYHEVLPELRRVRVWDGNRESLLRARWRADTKRQSLDWWRGFFEYVRGCPFLMGIVESPNGRKPFQADLEWLVRPTNFNKVIEGRYEEGRNVA